MNFMKLVIIYYLYYVNKLDKEIHLGRIDVIACVKNSKCLDTTMVLT